jgi:hypothetical protein
MSRAIALLARTATTFSELQKEPTMRERGVPGQLIARELAKVRTKMMTNKSSTAASRTSERQ